MAFLKNLGFEFFNININILIYKKKKNNNNIIINIYINYLLLVLNDCNL